MPPRRRVRSLVPSLALLLALGTSACAGGPAPDPQMELGRGDRGGFEPLADGDVLAIERGSQGGVHIVLAVRAILGDDDLDEPVELTVELSSPSDGALLTRSRYLLALDGEPDPDGFREEGDILSILPSLEAAADRDVLVSAALTPTAHVPALQDERTIHCVPPEE